MTWLSSPLIIRLFPYLDYHESVILLKTSLKDLILIIKSTYQGWYHSLRPDPGDWWKFSNNFWLQEVPPRWSWRSSLYLYHPPWFQKGTRLGGWSSCWPFTNGTGPVSLVLDLYIAHDRFGSSVDPTLNVNLYYPDDIDRSLDETTVDKIRKYHSDYDNNPPNPLIKF
jgi:hypothetical protein